jgi:hypothetical protein
MGIVASVTPGFKRNSTVPRVNVDIEELKKLANIDMAWTIACPIDDSFTRHSRSLNMLLRNISKLSGKYSRLFSIDSISETDGYSFLALSRLDLPCRYITHLVQGS